MLLACLGWVVLRREQAAGDQRAAPLQRFFGLLMVLFLVGMVLTFNEPDDSPRPRYLSMLLLPLAFLAAGRPPLRSSGNPWGAGRAGSSRWRSGSRRCSC